MRTVIFGALLGIISSNAYAGTLSCKGTVDQIAYHANNKFMVKLSSMNRPVFFCNPETTWTVPGTAYKTGPETCKMLYSTLLAAKATKSQVDYIHFDGDDVPANCMNWPAWPSANIRYINVK
ncbi:conserved exported hypothetical protein [Vibrio nigripulchritudo SOn1]|uniref:Secreted protein n=1 Tax=Vibrio nigripulchritudo SOn1 TaxID=1238450 RepID=A0AAV2VV93_9VIBR|nr:hypothetical protein TW74_00795 [Vibrio nigripulchritudo]CCO48540.1 conserved exported hypothetical protein [Vibrio nigripulchritudo SOn1]